MKSRWSRLVRSTTYCMGMMVATAAGLTAAHASEATAMSDVHGSGARHARALVGVWDCTESIQGAPYLLTFHADHTLRSTMPSSAFSDSHAIWQVTGPTAFRVTARTLFYDVATGTIAATATSNATGRMTSAHTLLLDTHATLHGLDGTLLQTQVFTLDCKRIRFSR